MIVCVQSNNSCMGMDYWVSKAQVENNLSMIDYADALKNNFHFLKLNQ